MAGLKLIALGLLGGGSYLAARSFGVDFKDIGLKSLSSTDNIPPVRRGTVTIEDIETRDPMAPILRSQRFNVSDMITSERGIDHIKKSEGLRLRTYDDGVGVLTIGYGHTPAKAGQSITQQQADALLRNDVTTAENAVKNLITVPLNQGEFDALVSFTFNLGSGKLRSSTLRRLLNGGDYQGAAAQFDRWVFAGGREFAGLVTRRAEERAIFEGTA